MGKDTVAAHTGTTLPITGERTVPGIEHENYWFRRHEVVYQWAIDRLGASGRVLDAGGGEGYGTARLTDAGHRAVCLDYDQYAAAHARGRYGVPVVRANLVSMPFQTGSFDSVTSMQVVEHLWDQPAYVRECARVLRPGGGLIASTPNRLTFSPDWQPGTPPTNLFHTRELSGAELAALVETAFTDLRLYGVHHGDRLRSEDDRLGGLIQAQLSAPPSEWSDSLLHSVRSVGTGDFVIAPDSDDHPIDSSLDLIVVATTGR